MTKGEALFFGIIIAVVLAFGFIVIKAYKNGQEFDERCIAAGGVPYHGKQLLCFDPAAIRKTV